MSPTAPRTPRLVLGLFRSTDGGASFTKVPTMIDASTDFAKNRSVGAVAVDPRDASHLYVGTAVARHGSSSVNGGRFTPPGARQGGPLRDDRRRKRPGPSSRSSQDSDSVNPSFAHRRRLLPGWHLQDPVRPDPPGDRLHRLDVRLRAVPLDGGRAGPGSRSTRSRRRATPATGLDSRVEFALRLAAERHDAGLPR